MLLGVQETNLGLGMNGIHQVFAYADDVNLIGDDIRKIERNADVLLNACKDIGSKHRVNQVYVNRTSSRQDSKWAYQARQ